MTNNINSQSFSLLICCTDFLCGGWWNYRELCSIIKKIENRGRYMFGITYDNWKNTCEMYFGPGTDSKKAYLQWFPFYKLSKENEDMIKSEAFYTKFIESGCFVFYPSAMHHSENFIQKNDGSFREAVLVSPIMYLVLQCIGREIFNRYTEKRPRNISVFYAGAYNENRPKYKRSYDDFFKYLNLRMEKYDYFIKTDITDFFLILMWIF